MSPNNCCCDNKEEELLKIIEKYRTEKGGLIPVLHEVQELYGYIPESVQNTLSEKMNIPLSEIYGVATFYSRFSLEQKGENQVSVCLGTACYVKGSEKVLEKIQEVLNIEVGKCSKDGKFSLDATRCVGACGLAPVMMINEDVYGKVTPDMVEDILKKYN